MFPTPPSGRGAPSSLLDSSIDRLLRSLAGSDPARVGSDFTAYRDRPVAFVREVLGNDPWERQEAILDALAREPRVSVRAARGVGKTWLGARAAIHFLQTRPGSIVITTAPSARQVRDLLWREIRTAWGNALQPLVGRCLQTMIDCRTDWYASGFSTDNPVNFQGTHSAAGVLVIVDEASGCPEWLYETIDGLMTQEGAKLLLIGNPNFPAGQFYESHRKWPDAQRFHISAFDVPPRLLRPDWKEEMLAKYGEESPVYQVHVLGNFPPQGSNSLFAMTWVDAAQNRDLEAGEPIEIGVDIARYGEDSSVAYVRAGSKVVDAEYWQGNDLMQSTGRVVSLIQKWEPSVVKVDVIGYGAGVVDRLAELEHPVIGINVAEAAEDKEAFCNKRAELFDGLAQRFKDGDVSIPAEDTELRDQLTALTYSFNSRGQKQLVSKDDLKKRGLASPDRADALMLTFASAFNPDAALGLIALGSASGWQPGR